MKRPPLFVFGAQRSGTTLIVRLLSRHPSVAFLPQETHIYPLFWKTGNRFDFTDNTVLAKYIEAAFPKVNNGWTLSENNVYLSDYINSIRVKKDTFRSANELMDYTFKFHTSVIKNSDNILGEKTPSHIYYYKQILKQFPSAKFLIAVRDPRASALSEKIKLANNTRVNRSFKLLNFSTRWETANHLAINMLSSIGDHRVHIVKYEDLIETPEQTIKKMCSFVEVDFLPTMLEMEVVNSSFKDELQKGKAFNAENLNRWKDQLNSNEIQLIESYLGKTMKTYNYIMHYEKPALKPALKNLVKIKTAKSLINLAPANFHHLVRHEKYRSITI